MVSTKMSLFYFLLVSSLIAVPLTNAYVFSDKTVTFGYEAIEKNAIFLLNDTLITEVNTKYPSLAIPLGSLTFKGHLYRFSEGLRPPRTSPIGLEVGFFVAPGTFIIFHEIYEKSIKAPGGDIVFTIGQDPLQPFQIGPYTLGTGMLTTNEGIDATLSFTAMGDVTVNNGIFESFSNGHVRMNSMTNWNPMLLVNGSAFEFETLYLFKFNSNKNGYWWNSYAWPWW